MAPDRHRRRRLLLTERLLAVGFVQCVLAHLSHKGQGISGSIGGLVDLARYVLTDSPCRLFCGGPFGYGECGYTTSGPSYLPRREIQRRIV